MLQSRAMMVSGGLLFTLSLLTAQSPRPSPLGYPTGESGSGPLAGGPPKGNNSAELPNSPSASPIMFTGRVVLDDGTTPDEPVRVERVCSGGPPHTEGFTDAKGHFSVTLGLELGTPGASETQSHSPSPGTNPLGVISQADLMNCELRAALPGFHSDAIPLANKRHSGNPDVGTFVLHRLANAEGFAISATSALAPKDARKAFDKGMEDTRKNSRDEARKEFEKAVAAYPKYAAAWFQLGQIYEDHELRVKAREAYARAIAADSKYINPYERLYVLGAQEDKWQEVAETSDRVIHLSPGDVPDAYYFNAMANLQLGNPDAAEKSAREAVKLDADHRNPRANYVLGFILAKKGEFAAAAEYLRAYLQADPNAKDADVIRQQLALIERSAQPQ